MQAMTVKTVRDSWSRSALALWWWFMLDRRTFTRIVVLLTVPNSEEWRTCWLMYEMFSRRVLRGDWSVPESNVSGRTRKKAEGKEEHEKRLEGYVEMESRRRQLYEAPMVCDSDEDEDDEEAERKCIQAERLVDQLDEYEDNGGQEDDKENRPPEPGVIRSFPWDSDAMEIEQLATEAESRKRQRGIR